MDGDRLRAYQKLREELITNENHGVWGAATLGEEPVQNVTPKKREGHFSKSERDRKHKPNTDWRESKLGERCYNASSLEVKDILDKHGLVSR